MELQWQDVVEGLGKAPWDWHPAPPRLLCSPRALQKQRGSKGKQLRVVCRAQGPDRLHREGFGTSSISSATGRCGKKRLVTKGLYVPGLSHSSFEIQQHWGNARQGLSRSMPRVLLPAKKSGGSSLWEKPSCRIHPADGCSLAAPSRGLLHGNAVVGTGTASSQLYP